MLPLLRLLRLSDDATDWKLLRLGAPSTRLGSVGTCGWPGAGPREGEVLGEVLVEVLRLLLLLGVMLSTLLEREEWWLEKPYGLGGYIRSPSIASSLWESTDSRPGMGEGELTGPCICSEGTGKGKIRRN